MEYRIWVYDKKWKVFQIYTDIGKASADYKELKIWYGKENVKITKKER